MSDISNQAVDELLGGTAPAAPQSVGDTAVEELLNPVVPKAKAKTQGLIASIKEAVVGNAEFDFPELPPSIRGIRETIRTDPDGRPVKGAALGGLLGMETDPDGKFNIFKRFFPSARKSEDANGNAYVTLDDGRNFYLDRPGLSRADVDEIINAGFFASSFAVPFAGIGQKALGAAGRLLGAGAGEAAGSVARQASSDAAGSEQGVDLFDAAVEGLFGIAGEGGAMATAAVAPAVKNMVRHVFTQGGYDPAEKVFTPDAVNVLRGIGIDPDAITGDIAERLHILARESVRPGVDLPPEQVARLAQAESLPTPVPLSRGDISRSPRQQGMEDLAERGALGAEPERIMTGFRRSQDEALGQNLTDMQRGIGGSGGRVVGEGADAARSRIAGLAETQKAAVDEAFKIARSKSATISRDFAQDGIRSRMLNALDEGDFDLEALPRVKTSLDFYTSKIRGAGRGADLPVADLEKWRRNAVQAAAGEKGSESAVALRRMIDAFDGAMDEVVSRSLIQGDEDAVAAWKAARLENVRFKEIFQSRDLIEKLADPEIGRDDAVRLIFGASKLGADPADLRKLKGTLQAAGAESDWNGIREEAFLRLLRSQRQGNARGADLQRTFSGDKFASALDAAMEQNKEVMGILFAPEEIKAMQTLKEVGLLATNRVKGGQQFSNTAVAALNLLGRLGPTAKMFGDRLTDAFTSRKTNQEIRMATTPLSPRTPALSKFTGLGAAAGGTAATQTQQE